MGTSPQFVTDYILHVRALRRHEESYQSLLGEIAEFQPQPLSDDEKRHVDAMKQHLYALNPGKDLRPIDSFVEYQFDPIHQWHERFGDRLNDSYLVIVLLSAAVVESYINTYLSLRCVSSGTEKLFEDIERIEILQKWLLGPKLFVPAYNLPKDQQLYSILKQLITTRNALAHYKVQYVRDNRRALEGKPLNRCKFDAESTQLLSYCRLPKQLLAHVFRFDKSEDMRQLIMMSGLPFNEINELLTPNA